MQQAIKYGSVCSGIEAATMAWEPLGWQAAWFAEIEPFPSKVLAHRWPLVPNLGNMCLLPDMLRAGLIEAPDVLVGGTPCQAFSVAGAKDGPRYKAIGNSKAVPVVNWIGGRIEAELCKP